MCVAVLVTLAGVGGWYYAKGSPTNLDQQQIVQSESSVQHITVQQKTVVTNQEQGKNILPVVGEAFINKLPAARQADYQKQVRISDADMRRLVQSARVELSDSK